MFDAQQQLIDLDSPRLGCEHAQRHSSTEPDLCTLEPVQRGRLALERVDRQRDCIVTAVSRELLEDCVKAAVKQFLAARNLQLAPEKTLVTHISEGFDFLGQNVRKYGDKLLIKPARKSVQALLEKVRR